MVGLGQGYIDWYVTVTISNLVEQRHPEPIFLFDTGNEENIDAPNWG